MVVKGRFPVVGDGGGVWSLIHIEDAAAATVAAIERGRPGIYNVADDEPAPVREWLPALAEAVGGRRPRHMPGFLGRLLLGQAGYAMMTEPPRASRTRRPSASSAGRPRTRAGGRASPRSDEPSTTRDGV